MSLDKIGSKLDEYLRIFESGSLKDEVKKMTVERANFKMVSEETIIE